MTMEADRPTYAIIRIELQSVMANSDAYALHCC